MVAPRIPPKQMSNSNRRKFRRHQLSSAILGQQRILIIPLALASLGIVWNIVRLYHSLRNQGTPSSHKKTLYPSITQNQVQKSTSWNYDWCTTTSSSTKSSSCSYFLPIDLQDYLPPDPEETFFMDMLPDPPELNDLFELDESTDRSKEESSKDKNANLQQPLTDDLDAHPDRLSQMILNPSHFEFPPTPKLLPEIRRNMSRHNNIVTPQNNNIPAQMIGGEYYAILSRRGLGDVHRYNQDRAVLIDPYPVLLSSKQDQLRRAGNQQESDNMYNNFFMGIWDGHGVTGHVKADYTAKSLPQFLMERLSKFKDKQYTDLQIQKAFQHSFWEAHRQGPLIHDSGCTSSVVVRLEQKLYFANTGDSRCMLVQIEPTTGAVNLTHITKRHKPNDPEERIRITNAGCVVIDPIPLHDPSARVVESLDGFGLALAMSRSLGDYDLEHCGVIPEPTVTSVDLKPFYDNNAVLLAICVTDGAFDYVELHEIANGLAAPFRNNKNNVKPLSGKVSALESAAEDLIRTASDRWMANTTFMPYRDDITIVVRRIQ